MSSLSISAKQDDIDNLWRAIHSEPIDLKLVKEFVENHELNVSDVNQEGKTVLHVVVERCRSVFCINLNSQLDIVKYLVEQGAAVNSSDNSGKTVLSSAVESGSLEITKYLAEHGADVNSSDKFGETVLHNAANSGSLEIVKYLVEHGAVVNSSNKWNKTVLHSAAISESLEIIKYLVEHGAEINAKGICGQTVLHNAAERGSLDIVKYLVEHGAEVNARKKFGETVLYSATERGSLEIVKYLVEHGADVNAKGRWSKTVLHDAMERKLLDIVRYLIECGAGIIDNIDLATDILKMAVVHNSIDFVQVLMNKDIDVRRCEKVLVEKGEKTLIEQSKQLGHHEISNILKLEMKKSVKHRQKIKMLETINRKKMNAPMQAFTANNNLKIGNGSNGTCIYVGVMKDGSEVAVKRMLRQSGEDTAENENEILSLTKAEDFPFIVSYRHYFRDDTFTYLVVDLCEENLKKYIDSQSIDYLRQHGPRMINEILTGLNFLHDRRILHRDLKPQNILVDIEGHMRLADFGISRVLNEDQTTDLTDPQGTQNWIPAEVIESINRNAKCRFKKKSDVQVTGMISFFILTKGKHPFGTSPECMVNIHKGHPVNLDNLVDLNAQQFISWLISHRINDRPYAHEALEHSFVNNF